jgi:hypothetical protein
MQRSFHEFFNFYSPFFKLFPDHLVSSPDPQPRYLWLFLTSIPTIVRHPGSLQLMGELTGSPLVDLGITAVQEAAPNLSPADVTFLRDMFDGLVQGTISHPEVVALLQPFPGATEAIDRVERILRIPPPPFASGSVGKEHETRWEVRAK